MPNDSEDQKHTLVIPEERMREIFGIVDKILAPYKGQLEDFSLELIMQDYNILGVGLTGMLPPHIMAYAFPVGEYGRVIALSQMHPFSFYYIGHELGHLVLGHPETRVRKYLGGTRHELTGFQRWERVIANPSQEVKDLRSRKHISDSELELQEAEFFSVYWNMRLAECNWMQESYIIDLDKGMSEWGLPINPYEL